MIQPKLHIERVVTWEVGQIILTHFANAKEPPTFTVKAEGANVRIWMSKRTHDWLKRVLAMDPRAMAEDK